MPHLGVCLARTRSGPRYWFEGTVRLALDLGIAAQYVVLGTALDPNLLGVGQLDFGQLDNTG